MIVRVKAALEWKCVPVPAKFIFNNSNSRATTNPSKRSLARSYSRSSIIFSTCTRSKQPGVHREIRSCFSHRRASLLNREYSIIASSWALSLRRASPLCCFCSRAVKSCTNLTCVPALAISTSIEAAVSLINIEHGSNPDQTRNAY